MRVRKLWGTVVVGAAALAATTPSAVSVAAAGLEPAATYGQVSGLSSATTTATTTKGSLVRKSLLSQLSPPSPDPSGIDYMADSGRLVVADSEVDEMAIYAGVNLWQVSPDATTVHGTGNTLKFSKEPTGLAYDSVGKRLFVSDDDKDKVFVVGAGTDQRLGTPDDAVSSFSARAFGNDDPEDVAFDSASGDLFISQGVGSEVYRLSPGANGKFDGVTLGGDDRVSNFDVAVHGVTDGESLGYSPTRDTLFVADPSNGTIVEFTKDGALVHTIDVSALRLKNPADIALAPATDDPSRTDIYVVTRGVDNDKQPDENDGALYEISAPGLEPPVETQNVAPVVSAGADQLVALSSAALLRGSVTDDGLPQPPGTTAATWSTVSGPGVATFGDPSAAETTVSFDMAGTYVLRLSATDSALVSADDVTVVVEPPSTSNAAPSVSAGSDQTITLPDSALLAGIVSDDGLPDPPATTAVAWSKLDGPGSVTFSDPTSTSTRATFATEGVYVLRLTADDAELTGSDEVTVVVQPAPAPVNLVKNSGFETDTSGWKGSTGTTLTRVASPRSGSWSGQLTNSSTASTRCTLNDSPNAIPTTGPSPYVLSGWVKGDVAGVGAVVKLVGLEYVGTTLVGTKEVSVALTTDWQRLELTYLPASPGSWLDFNVVRPATPAGRTCFLADDLSASTTS